jgi:hypothetical protein
MSPSVLLPILARRSDNWFERKRLASENEISSQPVAAASNVDSGTTRSASVLSTPSAARSGSSASL